MIMKTNGSDTMAPMAPMYAGAFLFFAPNRFESAPPPNDAAAPKTRVTMPYLKGGFWGWWGGILGVLRGAIDAQDRFLVKNAGKMSEKGGFWSHIWSRIQHRIFFFFFFFVLNFIIFFYSKSEYWDAVLCKMYSQPQLGQYCHCHLLTTTIRTALIRSFQWAHCHPATAIHMTSSLGTLSGKNDCFMYRLAQKNSNFFLSQNCHNSLNTATTTDLSPLKMTAATRPIQPYHCHPATATPSAITRHSHDQELRNIVRKRLLHVRRHKAPKRVAAHRADAGGHEKLPGGAEGHQVPEIGEKWTKLAENWPKLTENDEKWPKFERKWVKNERKWAKIEQKWCKTSFSYQNPIFPIKTPFLPSIFFLIKTPFFLSKTPFLPPKSHKLDSFERCKHPCLVWNRFFPVDPGPIPIITSKIVIFTK
jgi:hypothetical protein